MILADVLADYEKQLEAVGEEPEALSFVYRGLKQWDLTHFVLQLRQEDRKSTRLNSSHLV